MRRIALSALLAALLLPAPPADAGPAPAFTRARLLRSASIETVRVEDFTGDARPDILVQQSPGRELALFIQRPDGTFPFKPGRRIILNDNVFAWCLARPTGGDAKAPRRVCGITPDGIVVYPPLTRPDAAPEELLLFPTLFSGRSRTPPVYAGILRDLDGDGDTDCLLPQRDGVSVFRQTAPGTYALDQQIPMGLGAPLPQWGTGIGRLVTTYAMPRVLVGDLLGRGRPQLLFFENDMLAVHAAGKDGRFGWRPETELALRGRKRQRRIRFVQYQLPPTVRDLNGDGAADILHVVASRGEVHLFLGVPGGDATGGGAPGGDFPFPTVEKPVPATDSKKIDGYIPNYWIRDLDGDGRQDLLLATIAKLNVISGLQIFLTRQVDIQLMAFLNGPEGRYSREPDFVRDFTVPLSMYATRDDFSIDTPFFPNVEGDFNRDGRRDLVIKRTRTVLAVYPGTDRGVFAGTPLVELPVDALYDKTSIHVADLNGDGLSDLILHHVDWDTMFHDVELHISR